MGADLPFVVEGISPWTVVAYFVMYLITHFLIGAIKEAREKELKNKKQTKKEMQELQFWSILFKWYPAIYVVFILITLQAL